MNCKKCGSLLAENDQFCKNCGAAANEITASNINMVGNESNNTIPTNNMNSQGGQSMNNSMNSQPAWANGYNSQPTYNQMPQKKNGNTKFIIIGIIVAAAIIIGVLLFVILNKKDSLMNSESDGSSSQVSKSAYNVKFNGFTFKIPTNLVYESEEDAILLGDEEGTWATYIEVIEGSYSQMLANKNRLQGVYQQMGYTSSVAVEKTIGGMPFITLEISMSGTNALLGLAKANSMNMFGITAYNIDNEYDYKLLEIVSSILNSAEYTGETNNMSVFEKVDMTGIADLAK